MEWLSRFGSFIPYEHRVQAMLEAGRLVPLPINRLWRWSTGVAL